MGASLGQPGGAGCPGRSLRRDSTEGPLGPQGVNPHFFLGPPGLCSRRRPKSMSQNSLCAPSPSTRPLKKLSGSGHSLPIGGHQGRPVHPAQGAPGPRHRVALAPGLAPAPGTQHCSTPSRQVTPYTRTDGQKDARPAPAPWAQSRGRYAPVAPRPGTGPARALPWPWAWAWPWAGPAWPWPRPRTAPEQRGPGSEPSNYATSGASRPRMRIY